MEKPNPPRNRQAIQELIDSKVGENASLEYKSAGALDRKKPNLRDEITKDVSAFANAGGGILIYGVKEFDDPHKHHLPECITPVNITEYSREWLDQMIGQIQPRITHLEIVPVHVGPGETDFCYVVAIPQGETAHQATDKRHHRRRNFEVSAMDHYEIRDVMNRHSVPEVTVEIKLTDPSFDEAGLLQVRFWNRGKVFARDFQAIIRFPTVLNNRSLSFDRKETSLEKDNGRYFWAIGAGKKLSDGLLYPDMGVMYSVEFRYDPRVIAKVFPSIDDIQIAVYADHMPTKKLTKSLSTAWSKWT